MTMDNAELLAALEKRFDAIDNRFEKMDERFDKMETEITDVKTELADVKKEVRKIAVDVENRIEKKIVALFDGREGTLEKQAETESNIVTMQNKIENHDIRIKALETAR